MLQLMGPHQALRYVPSHSCCALLSGGGLSAAVHTPAHAYSHSLAQRLYVDGHDTAADSAMATGCAGQVSDLAA